MVSNSKPQTSAAEATGTRETDSSTGFISLNLLITTVSFRQGSGPSLRRQDQKGLAAPGIMQ